MTDLLALRLIFQILIIAVLAPAVWVTAPPASRGQTLYGQKVPVAGGTSYTNVSAAGLASVLRQKDFLLINVHAPYQGEIERTDLFIRFDEVAAARDQLPADKGTMLVVYCRSGPMGAIAARTLVTLGYTEVWSLDGGMIAWKQAGYSLVDKGRRESWHRQESYEKQPKGFPEGVRDGGRKSAPHR